MDNTKIGSGRENIIKFADGRIKKICSGWKIITIDGIQKIGGGQNKKNLSWAG